MRRHPHLFVVSTPIFKPGEGVNCTAYFIRYVEQKKADADADAKWEAEYQARRLANILSGVTAAAEAERVERERKTNEVLEKLSEEEQDILRDHWNV